jgi:hypothetical protein
MQRKYIWRAVGSRCFEMCFDVWRGGGREQGVGGASSQSWRLLQTFVEYIYTYVRKVGKCWWGMGTRLLTVCLFATHKSGCPWRHIAGNTGKFIGLEGALVNWLRIGESVRYSRIVPAFMEREGSLPCSQDSATGLYFTTPLTMHFHTPRICKWPLHFTFSDQNFCAVLIGYMLRLPHLPRLGHRNNTSIMECTNYGSLHHAVPFIVSKLPFTSVQIFPHIFSFQWSIPGRSAVSVWRLYDLRIRNCLCHHEFVWCMLCSQAIYIYI